MTKVTLCGTPPKYIADLANLDGIDVVTCWIGHDEVESVSGSYDFTNLFAQILAVPVNKKLAIGIWQGDFDPPWVNTIPNGESAEVYIVPKYHSQPGLFRRPATWTPAYGLMSKNLIAALHKALCTVPTIGSVINRLDTITLSRFGTFDFEMAIWGPPDMVENSIKWQALGFTPTVMLNEWIDYRDFVADLFPPSVILRFPTWNIGAGTWCPLIDDSGALIKKPNPQAIIPFLQNGGEKYGNRLQLMFVSLQTTKLPQISLDAVANYGIGFGCQFSTGSKDMYPEHSKIMIEAGQFAVDNNATNLEVHWFQAKDFPDAMKALHNLAKTN